MNLTCSQMPLLSIITINFNQADGLKKTICSVVDQSNSEYEFIIVDALSSDGSVSVIEGNKNSIHVCISEKDEGIYDGMNKGVAAASGDWIVFMNSGDFFPEKTTLESINKILKKTACDAVYGSSKVVYPGFSRIQKAERPGYWRSMPFVHQSFYCKRSLLSEHPFQLQYKVCADYDFYRWLIAQGKKLEVVDQTLSVVSSGGKSDKSRTKATMEKLNISRSYSQNPGKESVYFYWEFLKNGVIGLSKTIMPLSVITFFTKLKYSEQ